MLTAGTWPLRTRIPPGSASRTSVARLTASEATKSVMRTGNRKTGRFSKDEPAQTRCAGNPNQGDVADTDLEAVERVGQQLVRDGGRTAARRRSQAEHRWRALRPRVRYPCSPTPSAMSRPRIPAVYTRARRRPRACQETLQVRRSRPTRNRAQHELQVLGREAAPPEVVLATRAALRCPMRSRASAWPRGPQPGDGHGKRHRRHGHSHGVKGCADEIRPPAGRQHVVEDHQLSAQPANVDDAEHHARADHALKPVRSCTTTATGRGRQQPVRQSRQRASTACSPRGQGMGRDAFKHLGEHVRRLSAERDDDGEHRDSGPRPSTLTKSSAQISSWMDRVQTSNPVERTGRRRRRARGGAARRRR